MGISMIFRTAELSESGEIREILLGTNININTPLIFERLSMPNNTFVCEDGGRVAAIACFFSVSAKGAQGAFLYSLATHPAYEGEVLGELLSYSKKELGARGVSFLVCMSLLSEDKLFSVISQGGFSPNFLFESAEITALTSNICEVEFGPFNSERFASLRAKYARGDNLTFSAAVYEALAEHWQQKNAVIATANGAYCIYCKDEGRVIIREIFASEPHIIPSLIGAIAEMEEVDTATVHIGCNTSVPPFELGKISYSYGMTCALSSELDFDRIYMNLMFD